MIVGELSTGTQALDTVSLAGGEIAVNAMPVGRTFVGRGEPSVCFHTGREGHRGKFLFLETRSPLGDSLMALLPSSGDGRPPQSGPRPGAFPWLDGVASRDADADGNQNLLTSALCDEVIDLRFEDTRGINPDLPEETFDLQAEDPVHSSPGKKAE